MGIRWTLLSEKQRAMITEHAQNPNTEPTHMPQERSRIDSGGVLAESKVTNAARRLERKEQGIFRNWLLLHEYPHYWHRTDQKSGATLGCPDFIVGCCGQSFWIEFKRPGEKLSFDQRKFALFLETQQIKLHIVYSAQEAIDLLRSL